MYVFVYCQSLSPLCTFSISVQGKRPLRKCPIKGCEAEVVDLPRHLRGVHGWSKEMSRKATSRYGMRKSFLPKPVKKKSESDDSKKIHKDYHRHRPCPIEGCKSVVKRLSAHLRQVHRDIPVGSPLYKKNFERSWCYENVDTFEKS